jgi:hypothetical protein
MSIWLRRHEDLVVRVLTDHELDRTAPQRLRLSPDRLEGRAVRVPVGALDDRRPGATRCDRVRQVAARYPKSSGAS